MDLTTWEGEFLTEVGERVKTYGRAFADPEKGSPGQALSVRQAMKLRQITAKAKGEDKLQPRWKTRARKPTAEPEESDD